MCVRIRQEQAEAREAGTPPLQRPRSRWALAGATALVAGLAAAAVVAPSSPTKVAQADPAPVLAGPATVPTAGPVIEQTATTLGDDVPTAPAPTSTARGALGHCDGGM